MTNPLPAAGGTDAEAVDRAVRFGPLAFRSGDRAVTLADYRSLALQAGSVAKVRARTTGWNRVDLYVAPEGDTFTPAPDELKRRLVAYFETRRMVGTSVFIRDPVPVPVDIWVEIVTEHNFPPETVRQRAAGGGRRPARVRERRLRAAGVPVQGLRGGRGDRRRARRDRDPLPAAGPGAAADAAPQVLLDAGLGEVST